MTAAAPLIVVDDLRVEFQNGVQAVDGVSFAVERGECFGLVGESGSGKSTIARAILRLNVPTAGAVSFDGIDLLALSSRRLQRHRRRMQVVFQDPFASLNPRKRVDQILAFPLKVHRQSRNAPARIHELLGLVGLDSSLARRFPHELSGGQCQRVAIARALALEPDFLVLDEAVSSLDVSIQAQILNLLRDLQGRLNLTYLFISHDLSVIRYMCQTIAVMYRGRLVELASRDDLFTRPAHPYTRSLLEAIPIPDPAVEAGRRSVAAVQVREHASEVGGCAYAARCDVGKGRRVCQTVDPAMNPVGSAHDAACHFPFEQGSNRAQVPGTLDPREVASS